MVWTTLHYTYVLCEPQPEGCGVVEGVVQERVQ